MIIYTLGHSNHSWEKFVNLLRGAGIESIVDVRTYPRSRMAHFNQVPLRAGLSALGMNYLHSGEPLGGRSKTYSGMNYETITEQDSFIQAVEKLTIEARERRTALLCSEQEPLTCHRCLLIGRQLKDRGVKVVHILHDGSLETHDMTEERLLVVQKRKIGVLCDVAEKRLMLAYRFQEESVK